MSMHHISGNMFGEHVSWITDIGDLRKFEVPAPKSSLHPEIGSNQVPNLTKPPLSIYANGGGGISKNFEVQGITQV